jgi:hypothetical protein
MLVYVFTITNNVYVYKLLKSVTRKPTAQSFQPQITTAHHLNNRLCYLHQLQQQANINLHLLGIFYFFGDLEIFWKSILWRFVREIPTKLLLIMQKVSLLTTAVQLSSCPAGILQLFSSCPYLGPQPLEWKILPFS